MPYWRECFSDLGQLNTFSAGQLTSSNLKSNQQLAAQAANANALLVRSTTNVDSSLLNLMPNLSFVATATAGFDHLNTELLNNKGINWYSASGCNAQAVAQYVMSAILHLAEQDDFLVNQKSIGIIGNGEVGSRVAKQFAAFGCKITIFDPVQQANKVVPAVGELVDFETLLSADIICLHAPLNSHNQFPSLHMFNHEVLASLSATQYLINVARGELIDNNALLSLAEQTHPLPQLVLDVWENEPTIMRELIPYCRFTTPHIAGYSLEGRARGTFMLRERLCKMLGKENSMALSDSLPTVEQGLPVELVERMSLTAHGDYSYDLQNTIKQLCDLSYDIRNDDRVFRLHMAQSTTITPLRKSYPIRREYSAVKLPTMCNSVVPLLENMGYRVTA